MSKLYFHKKCIHLLNIIWIKEYYFYFLIAFIYLKYYYNFNYMTLKYIK